MRAALLLWLLCQPFSLQQPSRPKPSVERPNSDKQATQASQRGTILAACVRVDSIQANPQTAQADSQHREETGINSRVAKYTGALVVIAFLQLFMFLWQLWQIGRSLKYTRMAAEAAVNVERPHVACTDVIVKEIPPGGTQDPETGVFTPDPDAVRLGEVYRIQFVFTNYGRTPALDAEIGWGFLVGEAPPAKPEYKILDNLQGVLKPGEVAPFPLRPLLRITPDQRKAINEDKAFPWFWGFLRYRDFFNGVAEMGFVAFQYRAVILPTGVQLMSATLNFSGPPAYTYRRYTIGAGKTTERG